MSWNHTLASSFLMELVGIETQTLNMLYIANRWTWPESFKVLSFLGTKLFSCLNQRFRSQNKSESIFNPAPTYPLAYRWSRSIKIILTRELSRINEIFRFDGCDMIKNSVTKGFKLGVAGRTKKANFGPRLHQLEKVSSAHVITS